MFNLMPWRKRPASSTTVMPHEANPLVRLREEFDALFDRFLSHWPAPFEEVGLGRFWAFDVTDGERELMVRAEMPGFDPNDIDVQVCGQVLTIKAEKRHEKTEKTSETRVEERHASAYRRTVTLPEGADGDKVEARYVNGVLELRIPKTEEAKGKRIQVKE
jgi:HSP20 family protein